MGNGFDIGIGMPTQYEDFYKEYCKEQKTDNDNIKAFKQMLKKRNQVDTQDMNGGKELPKTGYTTDQYRLVGMLIISLTLILAYFTNRKRHNA